MREQFSMIRLTRLNHVPIYVNSDLIEHVEVTPDTVIALTSGQRFMVLESAEDVVERVLEFRRAILKGLDRPPEVRRPESEDTGAGSVPGRQEGLDGQAEFGEQAGVNRKTVAG
ncbi:MAG: flagellar FlbD family protein [Bryobacterales bacterium]|nr:flagellar FlbD family protein [Bryobacterales bacterium]